MSIIYEHPVSRLLLGENDDFQLPYVDGLSPDWRRGGQGNVSHPNVALLNEEINRPGIGRTEAQAIDDDFIIDLAGDEDFAVELEQQTELAQFAQDDQGAYGAIAQKPLPTTFSSRLQRCS